MNTPHPGTPVSELVSVVVPHYGDPAPTRALLRQLDAQEDAAGLRVLVVDDASLVPFPTDAAPASASAEPARQVSAPDGSATAGSAPGEPATEDSASTLPRACVRVIRRSRNGGFGAAVNTGLAAVDTPYALVLNSDLTVGPRFVADLVAAARPWQPAVVAPRVLDAHGADQYAGRHFPTVAHQTVEWLSPLARWRHTRTLHEAVGHDTSVRAEGVTSVDWVVGAAMLLLMAPLRELGGFDEGYHMNAEEVDLQLRLRALGIPSLVAGDVTVTHEGGGSSDSRRRRTWLVDARARYARRWGHPRTLVTALTLATAVNLAVNTVRAAVGRDVHPVRVAREELALVHPRLRRAERAAQDDRPADHILRRNGAAA